MPASDLILTPASISADTLSPISTVKAGEVLTEGDVVYFDTTDSKYKKADATDPVKTMASGIVISGCSAADQFVVVATIKNLTLTINAVATVNGIYVVSSTPGLMMLESDLVSTDYLSIVGVATSTSTLFINIWNTGYQIV